MQVQRDTLLYFPATKKTILEWASRENISFNEEPTHAAPNSWAWCRITPSTWYLVRILPEVDLTKCDGVVTELDVHEYLNRKRYNMGDVYNQAEKAATLKMNER